MVTTNYSFLEMKVTGRFQHCLYTFSISRDHMIHILLFLRLPILALFVILSGSTSRKHVIIKTILSKNELNLIKSLSSSGMKQHENHSMKFWEWTNINIHRFSNFFFFFLSQQKNQELGKLKNTVLRYKEKLCFFFLVLVDHITYKLRYTGPVPPTKQYSISFLPMLNCQLEQRVWKKKDINGQPLSSLAFGSFFVLSVVSFLLSLTKC